MIFEKSYVGIDSSKIINFLSFLDTILFEIDREPFFFFQILVRILVLKNPLAKLKKTNFIQNLGLDLEQEKKN